jgi:hypothetical protein
MTVVGDPGGMRALADKLVGSADKLRATRKSVLKRWDKVDMRGPYADAAGPIIKAYSEGFNTAASQLDAAAKTLRSSATKVEAEQEAERRRIAAAAAEAERKRRELAAQAAQRRT